MSDRAKPGLGERALKAKARDAAQAMGHGLGSFWADGHGGYLARCGFCLTRAAVVNPDRAIRDGKGYGGTAIREQCHAWTW